MNATTHIALILGALGTPFALAPEAEIEDIPTIFVPKDRPDPHDSFADEKVDTVPFEDTAFFASEFVGIPDATPAPDACQDLNAQRPIAAFSLPKDGLGSVWWISRDGLNKECQRPGKRFEPYSSYGKNLTLGPDFDGDGTQELIVSASGSVSDGGKVFIVSPTSGEILHVVSCGDTPLEFGIAVEVVPDQDGDGVSDLAVYSNKVTPPDNVRTRGELGLYSTKKGKLIRTLRTDLRPSIWLDHGPFMVWVGGAQVRQAGHLVISGSAFESLTIGGLSITTGELLWSGDRLECGEVARTADLCGDGVGDLLVAGEDPHSDDGVLRVRSGATGELFYTSRGWTSDSGEGLSVLPTDDFDGDGVNDILVNTDLPLFGGAVRVISGASGKSIHQFSFGNSESFWNVGWCMQHCPDMDGGGKRDLCISSFVPMAGARGTSAAIGIMSMETGELLVYAQREDMAHMIAERDGTSNKETGD